MIFVTRGKTWSLSNIFQSKQQFCLHWIVDKRCCYVLWVSLTLLYYAFNSPFTFEDCLNGSRKQPALLPA